MHPHFTPHPPMDTATWNRLRAAAGRRAMELRDQAQDEALATGLAMLRRSVRAAGRAFRGAPGSRAARTLEA